MKPTIKLFAIALILMGTGAKLNAQVSATATSSATVVTPIAIVKASDMNFGNVAVNATSGTVVLVPAGTRTATGGVTLPATAGTITAASFTITGAAGYTYTITLPSTATTLTSGSNTMTADTFTSDPTPTGILTGGTQTLTVGATLKVAASQPAGIYVSGTPFAVTVNYN
jgi:hypothetical protein